MFFDDEICSDRYVMKRLLLMLLVIVLVGVLRGRFSKGQEEEPEETIRPVIIHEKTEEMKTEPKTDSRDPLSLSFKGSEYYEEAEIRNRLAKSELEYCSYVTEEDGDLVFTWNLVSSGKEVYVCRYSFDRNRSYGERSVTACQVSGGYRDFQNGDRALIRNYVMPEKGDEIDMFVYPESSYYYEKYFILGKYSDMSCEIRGNDIYFEYSWYQDSEEGPVLVYRSNAVNTDTVSGKRYHEELWDLFEESYHNIDIIPYEGFERDKDYYDVYRKWKSNRRNEEDREGPEYDTDIYCECSDPEDLYEDYMDDFDAYEEAEAFYSEYCE